MIKAVVTDIEGTTTSLSFVKDVLFPYARRHIAGFVQEHAREPRVAGCLGEVRGLMGDTDAALGEIITQLQHWIEEDRKITPLKMLQGFIWEQGYRAGAFAGHVYEDAVWALRGWQAQGIRLYVYSSGSVHAQKLLFAHTPFGDLTPLFSGYYDTRIGGKLEAASYRLIAEDIAVPTSEILFLSDIEQELDAARTAGMATWQVVRAGVCRPGASHPQAREFGEIRVR